MYSVRLSDIRRTTSFRLALLFAGLFGAASLFLFAFIYWWTVDYVLRDIDSWIVRASASWGATPSTKLAENLNNRAAVQADGRHPIALFDSTGKWLAGNQEILPT